jgi:purine-binding chemotaxis protein CheW
MREMVTFLLADDLLGVDVGDVQEILGELPLTAVPLAPPAVAGLVNLRGEVLLAVDLRARMGRPPRGADEPSSNVIVRTGRGQVCLVVDRIGEVVSVRPDQFEPSPHTLDEHARALVRGAYTLPDRLLLDLDVGSALALDPDQDGRTAHPAHTGGQQS